MDLRVKSDRALEDYASGLAKLGSRQGRVAQVRAVNRTTTVTHTRVVRATVKQSSIPRRLVTKAVRRKLASTRGSGEVVGEIRATGNPIPLKEFKAKQFAYGVRARLRGETVRLYGMFIYAGTPTSGKFVGNGNVFQRVTSASLPIEMQFGPAVPDEIVKGEAKDAFENTVRTMLPDRLRHEIGRLLPLD